MSFSSTVKDELSCIHLKDEAAQSAALAALTHTAGSITIGRNGMGIEYVTENQNVGHLVSQLATKLYAAQPAITLRQHERLKAKNTVVILSGACCSDILKMSGCLPSDENEPFEMGRIMPELVSTENGMKAFLRGAFLGAGSVSNPKKGYHLEIVCRHERFAADLCALMEQASLNAKIAQRKSSFIVYMKDVKGICDMLTYIGAVEARLAIEDVQVFKSVANDLNRLSNFESANMQKTAQAAAQQLIDIELLDKEMGLANLPPKLQEAAEVRLNNPEATLAELADMLGIGKSGMNHRLNKLSEMARDIRLH